jgi:hypothetical protein
MEGPAVETLPMADCMSCCTLDGVVTSLETGLNAIKGREKALAAMIVIRMAIRAQKFADLILFILKPPCDDTTVLS